MCVNYVFGTGMLTRNLSKDIQLNRDLSNFTFQQIQITFTEVL